MPETKAPAQQAKLAQYTVTREETRSAAKHWRTPSGVLLILDDTHIAFATDWANLVLKNFVQMCAEQAAVQIKAMRAAKVVKPDEPITPTEVETAPAKKSSIILTD